MLTSISVRPNCFGDKDQAGTRPTRRGPDVEMIGFVVAVYGPFKQNSGDCATILKQACMNPHFWSSPASSKSAIFSFYCLGLFHRRCFNPW